SSSTPSSPSPDCSAGWPSTSSTRSDGGVTSASPCAAGSSSEGCGSSGSSSRSSPSGGATSRCSAPSTATGAEPCAVGSSTGSADRPELRVGEPGVVERVDHPLQRHRVVDDPHVLDRVERAAVLEDHVGDPRAAEEGGGVRGHHLVVHGLDDGVVDRADGVAAGGEPGQ